VIFPLLTGFSVNHSVFGFFTAAILALVGLMALYLSSPRLNLSRAAQESGSRGAFQQVSFLGASPLAQQIKMRRRLGVQHLPSRIPGRAGAWSLVWKDSVISLRAINLGKVLAWLAIFGASVGMVVGPGWGTRFWALIIWCLLVGQRGTERLRSDLELWVISRQLPFSGRAMMVSEIAVPVLITMLITWLAIGVSSLFGFSPQAYFVLLAPPAIISIVLAATYDILRKCHSSELLAGQVAEPGAVGLILGGLFAGIPVIIVYWLTNLSTSYGVYLMAVIFGSALGLGVSYLLWQLTTSVYRDIK
jgi:hypothetical protein